MFVLVLLVQVLIFNNVNLFGIVNIYVYLIFLISLPAGLGRDWQMLAAFLMGLCVDIFANTLGMHVFASVFVAFCRNWLLAWTTGKQELDASLSPSLKTLGYSSFLKYAFATVLLHHCVLFPLEDLHFVNFGHTLLMILCSVPASYAMIMCYYLLKRK